MDLTKTGRFKKINTDRKVAHKRLSNPGMMLRRRTGVVDRVRVRAREMRVPMGSLPYAARAVAARLPIAKIMLAMFFVLLASLGVLLGVSAYSKAKQIDVRVENGFIPMQITTTARTVRELLEQNGIRVGTNDEVTPALNTRLTNGMAVTINRAMVVFVTARGQIQQIYMTGGTVGDALGQANISYDQDDEVTPSVDTKVTAGIRIKHISVETTVIKEYQSIKYSIVYQNTSSLLRGKTKVEQSGKQGIQTKQIKVTYKDGTEVSRTELASIVTQAPESRIILMGTGVVAKPAVSKPSGNSGDKTGNSGDKTGDTGKNGNTGGSNGGSTGKGNNGGGTGIYAGVKPEDLVIPSVPTHFESVLYMQITAYTHTGRKTACGNWPQYTRTLKKPGTIAVDPNSIPYGTLLYVTGYGYCVAEDTGSNTTDSSRMGDVFMNTENDCYKWGRKRNVTVYVVQYNYKRSK